MTEKAVNGNDLIIEDLETDYNINGDIITVLEYLLDDIEAKQISDDKVKIYLLHLLEQYKKNNSEIEREINVLEQESEF